LLGAALTIVGALVSIVAITTTPGNTLVSILVAVLGLVVLLFGCALLPSRTLGAIVACGLGFGAIVYGLFAPDLETTSVLLWIGVGVLLAFFGVARVTTRLIPVLASAMSPIARWSVFLLSILVWPFFTLPYWLLRRGAWGPGGVPARIGSFLLGALNPIVLVVVLVMIVRRAATRWEPEWPAEFPGVVPDRVTANVGRENSRRNAQRTASTASALMIGLALVTLVATLAAGIVQTFRGSVDDLWKASESDYAITAQNNFSPIPIDAADAAAQAPGVEAVMNVRTGEVGAFGETIFATAVDPSAEELIALEWKDGSQEVLANLGGGGAFVDDGYADDHGLEVGSTISVTFPDGTVSRFRIDGIFDPPTGGSPFGNVTISTEAWDARVQNPRNLYSFIAMAGDVSDANTAALEEALADFPNAKVQTREQFIDNQIAGLNAVLNILYVLLALSVLVSLFGIVNTLVLTVFERTREIGMLRAIGMTRRQIRRMIRHESVITALIGAMLGIVLGVVLAVILIARVEFIDFAFPTTQIVVFVIAAVLVGIVAAIFPARRAAKLDPLEAIAYE
jgi:ABC-type lipoprotein release transport system permease subunit